MIGMLAFLLVFGLIAVVAIAVLQFLPYVLAAAAAIWLLAKIIQIGADLSTRKLGDDVQKYNGLLARAEQQHEQLMAGDDEKGVYGEYMPPKGLRKIGPKL